MLAPRPTPPLLAGGLLLLALLGALLVARPADAAASDPPAASTTTSGLAFGRDVTLTPGAAPATIQVIDGESVRVTVSARHPTRAVTVRASGGEEHVACTDGDIGAVAPSLLAVRSATAPAGETATLQFDAHFRKQRGCTTRFVVSGSAQASGQAPVSLPRLTLVHAYAATPFGALDLVEPRAAQVRVAGWAIDPETAAPIPVHVYIGGRFAGGPVADGQRPDVAQAFRPYGPAHGYDLTLAARPGTHEVCVYAINTGDGDVNPQLGCRTVRVAMPAACAPIQAHIDGLRNGVRALQSQLRQARPSDKPGIIAEIQELHAEIATREAALDRCLAAARSTG